MIRIIDIKKALTGLPAPQKGQLIISLHDPHCKWNVGNYLLQSDGSHLQVKSTKKEPEITMTIHGISALVYGTHSLEAIEFAQWMKGAEKDTRQLLQDWFPLLPLYNPYNF